MYRSVLYCRYSLSIDFLKTEGIPLKNPYTSCLSSKSRTPCQHRNPANERPASEKLCESEQTLSREQFDCHLGVDPHLPDILPGPDGWLKVEKVDDGLLWTGNAESELV